MNILLISELFPSRIGGTEVQALNLAIALAKQGHQIEILCGRGTKPRIGSSAIRLSDSLWYTRGPRLLRFFTYKVSFLLFMTSRKKGWDVICCRFLGEAAFLCCILKMLRVISNPVVAVGEDTGETGDVARLQKLPLSRHIIRILNWGLGRIVFLSPCMEKELLQAGFSQDKLLFIPNGVEVTHFHLRKSQGEDYLSIVFVGRLVEKKGLHFLFEAFSELCRETTCSLRLVIVGDGPLRETLKERAVRLEIQNHITWTGSVQDVSSILQEADIFVLPSIFEGFGIAVLEAMASGLPVVVTRCGGPEYFVTPEVGLVIEPENTEQLKKALLILIADRDLRQKMGRKGRDLVKRDFSIDHVAMKYSSLFSSLVHE
ncbi:MAG: glycosyltransferase family 4 protein [Candidatus Binatia bacterium]